MVAADYVTEREATAIRSMPLGSWQHDICNMAIKFYLNDSEKLSIPVDIVQRYMIDWQTSGLWLLPGTKEKTA